MSQKVFPKMIQIVKTVNPSQKRQSFHLTFLFANQFHKVYYFPINGSLNEFILCGSSIIVKNSDVYYVWDYESHSVAEYVGRYEEGNLKLRNEFGSPEAYLNFKDFLDTTEYPSYSGKFTKFIKCF